MTASLRVHVCALSALAAIASAAWGYDDSIRKARQAQTQEDVREFGRMYGRCALDVDVTAGDHLRAVVAAPVFLSDGGIPPCFAVETTVTKFTVDCTVVDGEFPSASILFVMTGLMALSANAYCVEEHFGLITGRRAISNEPWMR